MLVTFIISDVIYVIGGRNSKGESVNTLQSYDMITQEWANLPPMKEKRAAHAVCLQGDRIIVAGGDSGPRHLDTCEAFDTKLKRFVLPYPCSASHHCQNNSYSANVNPHLLAAGRPCRG